MNFYKHHLGDYDGATAHLDWLEDMAYTRLLRTYYRREAALPVDSAAVYRLVRAASAPQRRAVDCVLFEFFVRQDDGWHNKRADEEIAAYQHQVSVNRRVGKLGGRPNRIRTESVTGSVSEPKPNHNPNQEPETKNQKPEKAKASARARATPLPEGFSISERVKTWAASKGFGRLQEYLEFFVSKAKAKGYTYLDWDEALMGCIREDWPELRKGGSPVYDFSFADRKTA